jgi:hypothetical protein
MVRNTHNVNNSSAQTLYNYWYINIVVMARRDFLHTSRPTLWFTQSPAKRVPDSFPRVNCQEPGVDHQANYSAEVKEREELYLYSPSEPSLKAQI